MPHPSRTRRRILTGLLAAGVLPWHAVLAARKGLLPVTPSDAEGPFYPDELPADSDRDLLSVGGQAALEGGQVALVGGRVLNRRGQPIDGARVEIWQCDQHGVYHHPFDRGRADPRFQGFGATTTTRDGRYRFWTLRPVPYGARTPHIHFRVVAPGFGPLTTQLYVAEESERNARDGLYRRHDPIERRLVTAAFRPAAEGPSGALAARFDIVLA